MMVLNTVTIRNSIATTPALFQIYAGSISSPIDRKNTIIRTLWIGSTESSIA